MEYNNEHLLPGQLGHFFLLLAFVASILAFVAYSASVNAKQQKDKDSWARIGRWAFITHGIGVFSLIATVFYIMINQYYEYDYVWQHVSSDLDFSYIFSAFWEGQEGSFMLWMFWHVVLGYILIRTANSWEAPVLSVIALVQFMIGTMIIGLYFYFGDDFIKIGSNPLLLTRDVRDSPYFMNPDYLQVIKGNGLNPLLQNYWMTIHPPTLFLGFASTVVPFAYAVAGLWTKKHKEWLKPVLPWALFSGAILGLGILMGGAWAYEALSFGGYWAWDPVENMSLVPWIVMIAGIHTAVVARSTGYSIKSTYLFFILSFCLILYSTFLTRSGVLGETSVHAFTEMGLEWQLVIFIAIFFIPSIILLIARRKEIPTKEQEESVYSREFWMFIGALVLLFSSILISVTTSIPVYNKIATWIGGLAGVEDISVWLRNPPLDVVAHYNRYQIWIGVLVAILSSASLFLRYREKEELPAKQAQLFIKHIGFVAIASSILSFFIAYFGEIHAWQYRMLLWSGVFAIILNLDYIISVLKGNVKISGSAVSHMGFGIMLIGVIFSGVNKDYISKGFMQAEMIEGMDDTESKRNILLPKGLPVRMGDYTVTYIDSELEGVTREFEVNYKRFNEQMKIEEEFNLYPNILYNKLLTKIEASNPDTKHYLHKDIFTHVFGLPMSDVDPEEAKKMEDSLTYKPHIIQQGDTIFTSKNYVIFKGFNQEVKNEEYKAQPDDIPVAADLEIRTLESDSVWNAEPIYLVRDNFGLSIDDEVKELGLKFRFSNINPKEREVTIAIAETKPRRDYIVLQAILFPGINLVWLGSLMALFGMVMAMFQRREKRRLAKVAE